MKRLNFLLGVVAFSAGIFCLSLTARADDKESGKATAAKEETGDHKKAEAEKSEGKHESAQHDAEKGDHGHKAEEHHVDHDLSHGNAGPELESPAEIKFDMAIYTAVVFLLLLAILTKFAWGPISHGLEAREKSIEEKIEFARQAAERATAQMKEYEAKLAKAADEARAIVSQARTDAEAAKEKIMAEASEAAQRERERAIADIGAAKNVALHEIAQKSVDTAFSLARNIVRREVKPADHDKLIQDALKQFPSLN